MKRDWSEYLWATFMHARNSPVWDRIKNLHDNDDNGYFSMLEVSGIKAEPYPNDFKRVKEWAEKPVDFGMV